MHVIKTYVQLFHANSTGQKFLINFRSKKCTQLKFKHPFDIHYNVYHKRIIKAALSNYTLTSDYLVYA